MMEAKQKQVDEAARGEYSSKRRMTFVFLPIDAHGHVNAMLGIANQLRDLKHRTIFVCNDSQTPRFFGHELILLRKHNEEPTGAKCASPPEAATVAESEEAAFLGNERLNAKWAQFIDLLDLMQMDKGCGDGRVLGASKQDYDSERMVKSLANNYRLLKYTIEAEVIGSDERMERILLDLKPDLVLVDQLCPIPAVHRLANNPSVRLRWASLCSCNPLGLYYAHLQHFPPPLMGLPVGQLISDSTSSVGVQVEIERLRYERALRSSGMLELYGRLALLAGLRVNGANSDADSNPPPAEQSEREVARFALNQSPWLNIYQFPRLLDYSSAKSAAPVKLAGWTQVDSLVRNPLPAAGRRSHADELLLAQVAEWRQAKVSGRVGESPEKVVVVYVSLGTTISSNLKLMSALLKQLFVCLRTDRKWRFALALGLRASKFEPEIQREMADWVKSGALLTSNWWPQPELFRRKLVDVCLSHGGNNTLCELFQFKVPHLLLCPAFHDQLDNGRRLEELRRGVLLGAKELVSAGADDLSLLRGALERSLELESTRDDDNDSALAGLQSRDAHYCARLMEAKLMAQL